MVVDKSQFKEFGEIKPYIKPVPKENWGEHDLTQYSYKFEAHVPVYILRSLRSNLKRMLYYSLYSDLRGNWPKNHEYANAFKRIDYSMNQEGKRFDVNLKIDTFLETLKMSDKLYFEFNINQSVSPTKKILSPNAKEFLGGYFKYFSFDLSGVRADKDGESVTYNYALLIPASDFAGITQKEGATENDVYDVLDDYFSHGSGYGVEGNPGGWYNTASVSSPKKQGNGYLFYVRDFSGLDV